MYPHTKTPPLPPPPQSARPRIEPLPCSRQARKTHHTTNLVAHFLTFSRTLISFNRLTPLSGLSPTKTPSSVYSVKRKKNLTAL